MRTIKFRGKRLDSKEWVTGCYNLETKGGKIVTYVDDCHVWSETIGEFTGKTDKNGNEIYEGDFLLHEINDHKFIHLVRWDENGACFECDNKTCFVPSTKLSETQVIGNKWDNPELLKGV